MSEPTEIEPTRFLEFVTRPGLVVAFLAFHPAHRCSRAFARRLHDADGSPIPCGSVGLMELMLANAPALGFLRQGLHEHGVPLHLQVLPGYYLFDGGRLLAWDAGLPARADLHTVVGASLLGFLGYAFTRRVVLIGKALRLGAEEAIAARVAARFVAIAAEPRAAPRTPPPPTDPATELMNAYRLLGVDPSASDREINLAWRKLLAELHPDRAMHDPEELARRSRLVTELNRARDLIRKHRSAYAGRERRASA